MNATSPHSLTVCSKTMVACALMVTTTLGAVRSLHAESSLDGNLHLSQVISANDQTDRHISYTQLRSALDYENDKLSFHLDGRGRISWNETRDHRIDITRLFARYNHSFGWIDLGRLTILPVASARVDGAQAGFKIGQDTNLSFFAGLMPHPWDGKLNTDFKTTGLSYRTSTGTLHANGGIAFQFYKQETDRAFITQSLSWNPNPAWLVFAYTTLDLMSPRGILGDLADKPPDQQSGLERIDLTNGYLMIHYRKKKSFDLSFRINHHHTILPSAWWRDWIEEQRKRVGFVVDGDDPIGTRRSSTQLTFNLYANDFLIPYGVARLDYRHSDDREGYEGRAGAKLILGSRGFINVFYSFRRHYFADNHLASARAEVDLASFLLLETGFGAMHHEILETSSSMWLYDLDVGLWIDLRTISKSLKGLRCLLQAQAFIDPDMIVYLGYIQLSYRFGT